MTKGLRVAVLAALSGIGIGGVVLANVGFWNRDARRMVLGTALAIPLLLLALWSARGSEGFHA